MHKLISWYNNNRKMIWIAVITTISIMAICYYLINRITEQVDSGENVRNDNNNVTSNLNSVVMPTQDSVVTGQQSRTTESKITVIDKFVEYCNNGQIEEAYNLISDGCKNEMYGTVEVFKTNYYDSVFGGSKKDVSVENWMQDIYRLSFKQDALASGKYTTQDMRQDYITIVEDNNEYKLNINGLIKITNPNKNITVDGITINVAQVNTYMDYETYVFEIKNPTSSEANLGDLNSQYAVYLQDEEGLRYGAYLHELGLQDFWIKAYQNKTLKVKFYNKYISDKYIERVVFSSVSVSYEDGYGNNIENMQIDM